MTKEGQPIEPSSTDKHEIVLGVPFKPFRGVKSYPSSQGKEDLVVPESYAHYLYLRRGVSFNGINGVIDVIEDDPKDFMHQMAVMASPYRLFIDYPLGRFMPETAYRGNGQYEPIVVSTCLRFSFLVKTPSEYTKLLTTYGDVFLGKDKFLLIFNLNQQGIKRGLQVLEEGKKLLVIEKNLFNYKELEKMEKKPVGDLEIASSKKDKSDPGRIAFVRLPENLRKLRTTEVVFNRFNPWGESEYPAEPIQPNMEQIPILV